MKCHRVFGGLVTRRQRGFFPPPRIGHPPPREPRYPVTLHRDTRYPVTLHRDPRTVPGHPPPGPPDGTRSPSTGTPGRYPVTLRREPRYPVTLHREPHGPVCPGTRSPSTGTPGTRSPSTGNHTGLFSPVLTQEPHRPVYLLGFRCYGELIPITA